MTTTFTRSAVANGLPAVRVFVLETNGNAILAFEAATMHEAMELGREAWLRNELEQLTSNGFPVWDSEAPTRTRTAFPEERDIFKGAAQEDANEDLHIVT